MRDCGDGVFEDQLFLGTRLEQDGELVEALNPPEELGAVQQIDDYRGLLAAHRIQKCILDILWCRLPVGHYPTLIQQLLAASCQITTVTIE